MKIAALLLLFLASAMLASEPRADANRPTVLVVVGAAGEESYGADFAEAAASWNKAGQSGGLKARRQGGQAEIGRQGQEEVMISSQNWTT